MPRQLRLERDSEIPTRWLVMDAADVFVGTIDKIGDAWQNTCVAEGKPLQPVPLGPFKRLEGAFDAFEAALYPEGRPDDY
jgi:hypothetical protein